MVTPAAPAGRATSARTRHWLWAAALLAAATLVGLALDDYVSLASEAMLYVLAVAIAAYTLPRAYSLVCAVAAVALLNYFFTAPRFTFRVDDQDNLFSLFALLGVALTISSLGTSVRRETERARLNASRARELQELATELASATTAGKVDVLVQQHLERAFVGPCLVAVLDADGCLQVQAGLPAVVHDGLRACIREGRTLGRGTGRWPGLDAWYIPMRSDEHTGGAACIQNVSAYDQGGLEHANAICALAGQALWRLKLAAAVHDAEEESQWHRAQSTFLAAISHDFRTPLAAIMGAASSLQTQWQKLAPAEQDRLLRTIVGESSHLARLTDNTLQLVRLENAGELRMDWESIEEIIGSVLARVRARGVPGRVTSAVPPNLPLIKADPVLLAQLLENLLENALKYSRDVVELQVQADVSQIRISVHDRGDGIAAGDEVAIFEPYRRGDTSGQRGAGLGLALCRAIARAHGGELSVTARPDGGSTFAVKLPIEYPQPAAEFA